MSEYGITKDEIPAVTQLFTPDWIVRYMVENSLGRLFINYRINELGTDLADESHREKEQQFILHIHIHHGKEVQTNDTISF